MSLRSADLPIRPCSRSRAALRALLAALVAVSAAGCLPDLADDAALAAHLAALDAGDGSDELDADATLGDDGDAGADSILDDIDDDGAIGDTADGEVADTDAPAGDADALDAGDGNLGTSCSNNGDCVKPASAPPCQVAVCATGTCALTAAVKGTPCVAVGLSLQSCQQTRCTDKGACAVTVAADGTACDADDNGCTVNDLCVSGTCSAGAAKSCPPGDNPCALQSCHSTGPNSAICKPTYAAEGKACDDGVACTDNDACDGAGTCGGVAIDCAGASGPCTVGECEAATGDCKGKPKAKSTPCDDGDNCTGSGSCDADGVCAGLVSVCDDKNPCTDDVCDGKGGCTSLPHTGACSDGDPCTSLDACDGKGACVPGKPRLFDKMHDAAPGATATHARLLSTGHLLVLGQRSDAPWLMRSDLFGKVDVDAQTGGYTGKWSEALERDDGGWLAAGVQLGGTLDVPIVGRFGKSGTEAWVVPINAESQKTLAVAALLPAKAPQVMIAAREQLAGGGERSRLFLFDEVGKKATGAGVSLGSSSDPRGVYGGVREDASKRWVFVGRHKVNGAWRAWIYRLQDTLFFGGEQDYSGAPGQRFADIALAPGGGYYAVGDHDKSSLGQDIAWLVRVDNGLKQLWWRDWGTDTGVQALSVAVSKAGEVIVAGFASTGIGVSDSAGFAWRVSSTGGSEGVKLFAAAGGSFYGVAALGDGYIFGGDYGIGSTRKGRVVRTTNWLHASCVDAGGCAALAPAACDDGDPCTTDSCAPGSSCGHTPQPAGTTCGPDKVCNADGSCG